MKRLVKVSVFLVLFISGLALAAQEFDCQVTVNALQVESTERRIFDDMETEFANFLNERKWSNDRFENQERIRCAVNITLESQPDIGSFTGAVQIIAVRPVFSSSYETTLINFADRDFDITYTQAQPLNFNETTFQSNITSILGFYAMMMLGYDYDSFGKLGGDEFYQTARQIANAAQTSGRSGWDQFNSQRNRYWWADNANDQVMRSFREGMYQYHRQGLDLMSETPDEARQNILEALKKVQSANRAKPRSILIIGFIDAKADELVSIFSQGDMSIRKEVYDILRQIDPSRSEEFKSIISN